MRVRVPPESCILALCALALLQPAAALAALRSPQVAISGNALQAFLNSVLEYTDVRTTQDAIQAFGSTVSPNTSFTAQFEWASGVSAGTSVGIYDAASAAPVPMELFPSGAGPGWFAVATFRFAPVRVVVNLFDQAAEFRGTTTYPGGNRNAIGLYMDRPGGRFYSQDHRNPAGDPQLLWFAATGMSSGSWWIAGEDTPLSGGADGDFDDVVIFADPMGCPCPVQQCSWGAVKARFR